MKATPKIAMISPTSVTGYFQGSMVTTGILMPYEVMVLTVEPGSVLVMPPDTGDNISFIQFRLGTKSLPVVQQAERKFQIVLDVPGDDGGWVDRSPGYAGPGHASVSILNIPMKITKSLKSSTP